MFVDGVQQGITASRAWRSSDSGAPGGVFTVDFFLKDLESLLDSLAQKIEGFSVILEPNGTLICASDNPDAASLTAALGNWIKAHPQFKNINAQASSDLVPISVGTTSYLAALDHVQTPFGLKCIVAGMVPKSLIFSRIDRAVGQMGLLAWRG